MDSPAPFERRSVSSWPSSSSIATITSSPTITGPELYQPPSASAPLCYTPDLDAVPLLDRSSTIPSPSTSSVGTPISTPPVALPNSYIHSLLDHATSMIPPPIDPRLTSTFAPQLDRIPQSFSVATPHRTPSYASSVDLMNERDHEITFLLRWFSEGPGYWMDLFDLGNYFSTHVPVIARDNPLLKYAAVAYAAKTLARVQGRKPVAGGSLSWQARMEQYPEARSVDWYQKAAHYYNIAVSLLLQTLKNDTTNSGDSDSDGGESTNSSEGPLSEHRRDSSTTSFRSNNDELLAASAILCVYEFLDASGPEWTKHLNGAKSLLSIAQERTILPQLHTPSSMSTFADRGFISKARQATFWNIARQDMLAACTYFRHRSMSITD